MTHFTNIAAALVFTVGLIVGLRHLESIQPSQPANVTIESVYVDRADPDVPTDQTGRDSIIVELESGDWVELRGPGRFDALDYFGVCKDCEVE